MNILLTFAAIFFAAGVYSRYEHLDNISFFFLLLSNLLLFIIVAIV